MSPWLSLGASAITATVAFAGVALTQRSTRARDFDGRLWEARSKAYVALMRWVIAIEKATLRNDSGAAALPPRSVLQSLELEEDLAAEVSAYASASILARHQELLWWLRRATQWSGDEPIEAFPATQQGGEQPAAEASVRLSLGAGELRDLIRLELEQGAERVRAGRFGWGQHRTRHGGTGPVAQRAKADADVVPQSANTPFPKAQFTKDAAEAYGRWARGEGPEPKP